MYTARTLHRERVEVNATYFGHFLAVIVLNDVETTKDRKLTPLDASGSSFRGQYVASSLILRSSAQAKLDMAPDRHYAKCHRRMTMGGGSMDK